MTIEAPIAVFAYAFPHRKTKDFIFELACAGFKRVCVIAAPWKKLSVIDSGVDIPSSIRNAPAQDTRDLCALFGFAYHEMAHDDLEGIDGLRRKHDIKLGIVAGARILKASVVAMFETGIVNFHPGKLPEAGGLDAFFKTIAAKSTPGVTVHFIDHRVDAGRELFFEETELGANDAPEVVRHNIYQTELHALRRFARQLSSGEIGQPKEIVHSEKTRPMDAAEKLAALDSFAVWRAQTYLRQRGEAVLKACQTGDVPQVTRILDDLPELIEFRSREGWTPLIVASFHQKTDVVDLLIVRGADVNATNKQGTTVLMYAKTAVTNKPEADYSLLRRLIDAGADAERRDRYGRSIIDYVNDAGDARLAAWLSK